MKCFQSLGDLIFGKMHDASSSCVQLFVRIPQLDLKNAEKITDEKIIDFYIWQFSKMMKDSKQMNGNGFRKKIRYE